MRSSSKIYVVHGALGSAAQMEPVAAALRGLGEVHNIELPGHGLTPLAAGEKFSIENFVRALEKAITKADSTQAGAASAATDEVPELLPTVFGYSMGGYVALALEAQRPGTFSNIVTLGTKFAWNPALALREFSRLDANIINEKVPKFAAVLMERHADGCGWNCVLEQTAAMLAELGDSPVLTRQTLSAVEAHACIAVGEADDTVSAEESKQYAEFIVRGNVSVLPGVPHPIEKVPMELIVNLVRDSRS